MIDLSKLAAPDAVESLDYEVILAELQADIVARAPQLAPALALETEPITINTEAFAYRELVLRQRINNAVRARMLAFATGTSLEHLAAGEGLTRLLITPADTTAVPPVAAVYESDEALKTRVLLSFDAKSTAGASGTYEFFALSSSGQVKSALAYSHSPGTVTVYVLSHTGTGVASSTLCNNVRAALSAQNVRPMNDVVSVASASIVDYSVDAVLYVQLGPDPETVRLAAVAAVQAYAAANAVFGACPYLSGLSAAAQQAGVRNVVLTTPSAELAPLGVGQVAVCTSINITVEQVGA